VYVQGIRSFTKNGDMWKKDDKMKFLSSVQTSIKNKKTP
jgi:hypothetical protein